MFAYSFGSPTDEWNSKKLNSPLPCPYGVKCTKDNCIGVHPGEEGTKRKYFPGRNVPHKVTGNMVYQQPCVRLVGNDKYDIPGYYKRRTQKLSWPEWCKAQPLQPLQPIPIPTPKQLIDIMLPGWTPPSIFHPIFKGNLPVTKIIEHFHYKLGPIDDIFAYRSNIESHNPLNRDSAYMYMISLSRRFTPSYHLYPQLLQADFLMGSQLTALHLAEDSAMEKARTGDKIFARVSTLLAEVEPITREKGHWVEGFGAAKATGMIMEMLYSDPDPVEFEADIARALHNDDFLKFMVAECLVTYSQAKA